MSETGETIETLEPAKEEALIKQGQEAEQLLTTDAFHGTITQLIDQTFNVFTGSSPEDTQKREAAFYAYRGICDIVDTLQQRVVIKNQILEHRAGEDNNYQEEE